MQNEPQIIPEYPNYQIYKNGVVMNHTTGKIISTYISTTGYRFTRLWKNNFTQTFPIHRLLAKAYIPNPENKREVNHIDGNKFNNSLDNLEWATPSENMKNAMKRGVVKCAYKKGFNHVGCKLKMEDIIYIREKRKNKEMKLKELAVMFNVTPDHICRVARHKHFI